MKRKIFYILLIFLSLTSRQFTARTTFREKTENWLKSSGSERPTIPENGEPEKEVPEVGGPAGDAIGFALALSLLYGIHLKGKKWKKATPYAA